MCVRPRLLPWPPRLRPGGHARGAGGGQPRAPPAPLCVPALVVSREDPEDSLGRDNVRQQDTVRSLEEPDACPTQDLQVALDDRVGASPEAAPPTTASAWGRPQSGSRGALPGRLQAAALCHDGLHDVDVRTVVNILAVRPLQVRNGTFAHGRRHEGQVVPTVRAVALKGTEIPRLTGVNPGLPAQPVPTERALPQLLGALERRLQVGVGQVASALERAAEAKLAVPECTHELPFQRLCRAPGPATSLPVVRRAAATTGGRLAARGTAAAAPVLSTGRLAAATLWCWLAARGTAAGRDGRRRRPSAASRPTE